MTRQGGGYTQEGMPASTGTQSSNVTDRLGPPVTSLNEHLNSLGSVSIK